MGVLGTTRMDPEQLEQELHWIDGHTAGRPYALDLALPNKMEKARPMAERARVIPQEHIRFVDELLASAGIPPLPAHEQAELDRQQMGYRLTAQGGMERSPMSLQTDEMTFCCSRLGQHWPSLLSAGHPHLFAARSAAAPRPAR